MVCRSEETGEAFAGTASPKGGIADGVTMAVMEMSMSESMHPCDFPQTYMFDRHEAQGVSHSVPTKRNGFFIIQTIAKPVGVSSAFPRNHLGK